METLLVSVGWAYVANFFLGFIIGYVIKTIVVFQEI